MSRNSTRAPKRILALAFALSIVAVGGHRLHADPVVGASVDVLVDPVAVFYDALAPYGDWISTYEYGWVWVPSAHAIGPDFVPYATDGQWVYTDSGWFFQSDYEWGWAPFHYGRWYFDNLEGWVWVPGRVWAAAWVDWRVGAGLIGWSPMPPRPIRGVKHPGHWVFVAERDFRRPHIHAHLVTRKRARHAYDRTARVRQSRRVGDATIFRGPRVTVKPSQRIRVVPPRRGVVSRVRIIDGAAAAQPMRPRPGIARPVDRRAVRRDRATVRDHRRAPSRVKQPTRAVRKPVRVRAPRASRESAQRQRRRRR